MSLGLRRRYRGFNLVETIVAGVVLSGTVVTVSAISSRSLVATRLNRQYEAAASLVDRQMAMIQYAGVDELVQAGRMEGRMDDVPPGFQWTATTQYTGIDALYTVTVTVSWIEQGRPYSLSVDTQMNGASTITSNATGQTTTTGS